jgi:hypothetical protein
LHTAIAHRLETPGECQGAVLNFQNTSDIEIERCTLLGSGTFGIEAEGLRNLRCQGATIQFCTDGILCLNRSQNLQFTDCQFMENQGLLPMINLVSCEQVLFSNTLIHDNVLEVVAGSYLDALDAFLFNVWDSTDIEVVDCQIYNNQIPYFASIEGAVQLTNTPLTDNAFTNLFPSEVPLSGPFCPAD